MDLMAIRMQIGEIKEKLTHHTKNMFSCSLIYDPCTLITQFIVNIGFKRA
jgi:hypothetical protein